MTEFTDHSQTRNYSTEEFSLQIIFDVMIVVLIIHEINTRILITLIKQKISRRMY